MARYLWNEETRKFEFIDDGFTDPNAKLNGSVWCPEQGYYDKILNRRFETKREKRAYMRANGLMMESGDKPHLWDGKKKGSTYYSFPGQKTMSRGYKYR